ncbi:hypothetical protein OH456_12585 [Vibrio sp. La 4.2.2]|uniref:glycoside hydrolase family 108 protein n=1 Tax=Vibrio sp. La 4.2.2 TaxID=2998830 RepID=UPI0022CE1A8B|nr:putative peptidoglycan-binding domain-containing protein [Vibrio sp. La 4.2.2]MDA0108997.1 hypothetical protein [Vibrio sp. La 4.2.2]
MCKLPVARTIYEIIYEIMEKEGFRSNNKDDLGGDTTYGITEKTARNLGYKGLMNDLTPDIAKSLYLSEYVQRVRFDEIHEISAIIGEEVIDTGVNMGQSVAAKFLQRWLNVYNNKQAYYSDLTVDGHIGPATIRALTAFLSKRGHEGEVVLWKSLNASQGARYLDISEAREKNETFVYGWMKNRVGLA